MKVYCFDLDDTLISELDYVLSALGAVGRAIDCLEPEYSAAGEVQGGAAEWMIQEWRRTRSRTVFEQALARKGLEVERHRARLIEIYRTHSPVLGWRAGVAEVLTALAARGHQLALVSDGYLVSQQKKWAVLGTLTELFRPVVFTDIKGRDHWKPNPWGFEQVMAACPAAESFFYVGDNPEKDFVAPNQLGWTTIEVRHPDNLRPVFVAPRAEDRARFQVAEIRAVLAVQP